MDRFDLQLNNLFTTDGIDVWKLRWYCFEPMCELENMETHEKRVFGMGGLTAQEFRQLKADFSINE